MSFEYISVVLICLNPLYLVAKVVKSDSYSAQCHYDSPVDGLVSYEMNVVSFTESCRSD